MHCTEDTEEGLATSLKTLHILYQLLKNKLCTN